ncbi:MAG: hypothetical protein JRL30_01370 [Deltaproteobacteria bacterium]|nr:hypothetical protein [Deltaproteobacteria bacterium]
MDKPIIGFVGKARSGKDTAGKALLDRNFYRAGVADEIAVLVGMLLGQAPYELRTADPETRARFQEAGNLGRAKRPTFWLDKMWGRMLQLEIDGILAPPDGYYIPNIRFPVEAHWVKAKGGILIGIIDRGGLEGDLADDPTETAIGETLELCDVKLSNVNTIDWLQQETRRCVTTWMEGGWE